MKQESAQEIARFVAVQLSVFVLGVYSQEVWAAQSAEEKSVGLATAQTVQANNDFAIALYRRLSQEQEKDNLFFSPYSLFSALGMVMEGARGETARQMGEGLRFPVALQRSGSNGQPWDTTVIHTGVADLQQRLTGGPADPAQAQDITNRLTKLEDELDTLNQQPEIWSIFNRLADLLGMLRQRSSHEQTEMDHRALSVTAEINTLRQQVNQYELRVANALWGEQTFPFRPQFVQALQMAYGAVSFPVDFLQAPDTARLQINAWIEQQTKNRIRNMLPPGSVDWATRLVLTNAIYFKGNWDKPFQKQYTKTEDFTLFDGLQTPMQLMSTQNPKTEDSTMSAQKRHFRYVELMPDGTKREPVYIDEAPGWALPPNPDGFQMLEIPYRGNTLSMVILLPRSHNAIHKLEHRLTAEALPTWLALLSLQEVHVYLPRFRMETSYSLTNTLSALGMPAAFQAGGFTGISDAPQASELALSQVAHKAFVQVDEEGTEAAAASAATMRMVGLRLFSPTPVFRADRPFLFLIRDSQTGAVLFLGRVMRPQDS